ncbi:MAG: hypothetical protein Q4A05_11845 [Ruminococcus sp.]|nr:hypothetical protein [Ruminococcus sp.]
MIVNCTKYSEKDFEFMSGLEKFRLKVSPKKVISLIIDVLIVIWGTCMLNSVRGAERSLLGLLTYLIAIMIVVNSIQSLYSFFTRKKRRTQSWIKGADIGTPRLMEFGVSSVTVTVSKDGITTKTTYGYELIKSYISTEDCLYVICNRSGSEIFMILHDDSYTEGSKAELTELLRGHGAAEERA